MYAKLRHKGLEFASMPLKTNQGDIFTNDPQIFLSNGYKPVLFCSCPDDGKHYEPSWVETDKEIIQEWVEKAPPPASARDLLNIITGGT